jgi:RNA polymerase sigma-70 factor (ECF subfamily)
VTDNNILSLLLQRSEDALSALAARFGRRLYLTAINILGSVRDAEESVSDTYLAVWNAIPPKKPDPLSGFVYSTGRNHALKKLRSRSAAKRGGNYDLSLEELAGCIPGPALEETVEARELGMAIDRFLDRQNAQTRAIFLRRYWFGDSVKDSTWISSPIPPPSRKPTANI